MKLFLISQDVNNGYDTYDSAVVVAHDEEDAKIIYPSKGLRGKLQRLNEDNGAWVNDSNLVKVVYLGEANPDMTEPDIICASFNAG